MIDVDKHPLVIKRREFYKTWYGKLTRADSYVEPWVGSVIILIALGLVAFQRASAIDTFIWILAGLLWGTLYEYLNHRFLFHRWVDVPGLRGFQHVHLPHHVDLKDGINAGPFSYLPVLGIWWSVMWALSDATLASLFMMGMTLWFMWYEFHHDFDHLKVSQGNSFMSRYLRYMQVHHADHHDHPTRNFGITTPVWDFIFRSL